MTRRLLNLLPLLSLLLFVAVVVVWVRSYFVTDWIYRDALQQTAGGVANTESLIEIDGGMIHSTHSGPGTGVDLAQTPGWVAAGVYWRWEKGDPTYENAVPWGRDAFDFAWVSRPGEMGIYRLLRFPSGSRQSSSRPRPRGVFSGECGRVDAAAAGGAGGAAMI